MPGFMSKSHSEELDFELFSNIVLKFTSILMVVLVLLAINVGQKLDQIISPYRFSGGLARPQLYIAVYAPEDWINLEATMSVTLLSASRFEAATIVDPKTGEIGSKRDTETFSGAYGGNPYHTLGLLAGISPGTVPIDGKQTPFVVPHFSTKTMFHHDKDNNVRYSPPSQPLAHNFLTTWSDSYANPVYPTRAFSEYKDTRTRIYVETLQSASGEHFFVIGHDSLSAAQIKAGSLDFLTSLSSTNTEVVYLGNYYFFPMRGKESRLDFYEKNGFTDAAKDLRSRLFPGTAERAVAKTFYDRLPTWDQLSSDQKSARLKSAKEDAALAREQYEASITRRADFDYRNSLTEDALKKGVAPDVYGLPNNLAYPDAWQAYVDDRIKANPAPPDWFVTELLQPLGFDKRVVVLEQ